MDDSFGKVTQALKDAGRYDNSIIIFSSDVSILMWEFIHLVTDGPNHVLIKVVC